MQNNGEFSEVSYCGQFLLLERDVSETSGSVIGVIQFSAEWIPTAGSSGAERRESEADKSPLSTGEVTKCGVIPPQYLCLQGVHGDVTYGDSEYLNFYRQLSD